MSFFALITESVQKQDKSKTSRALVKHKSVSPCEPLQNVELGQVLLCKIRGFAEWPATVTDINDNAIEVTFFGDGTTYTTSIAHLFDFKESHEIICSNLQRLKSPLYKKSVKEAELALKIPSGLSILS